MKESFIGTKSTADDWISSMTHLDRLEMMSYRSNHDLIS